MRKFYLQKDTGERIGLNNETGIFLSDPEGLGLEFDDNYADIGEGFFRMISKRHSQKTISCKLNFVKDPYKTYNDFITWCMKAEKLYLIYQPLTEAYYIRTEIAHLDKTEINKYGYLETDAEFLYLSPWYLPTSLNISFIGLDDTAFRIGQSKFDGPDILAGTTAEKYTAEVNATGHLPGAFLIEYKGIAENPEISLVGKISGQEYGNCKIDHAFTANTGFRLSTAYEDSYIKEIKEDGSEVDLLADADLSLEPFFKIPLTEPCVLRLTDDGALHGTLNAKVYYYYRSV